MKPPPESGTLPIITCPACGHQIDQHGAGLKCSYVRCPCRWTPNDIAAARMTEALATQRWQIANRIATRRAAIDPEDSWDSYAEGLLDAYDLAEQDAEKGLTR